MSQSPHGSPKSSALGLPNEVSFVICLDCDQLISTEAVLTHMKTAHSVTSATDQNDSACARESFQSDTCFLSRHFEINESRYSHFFFGKKQRAPLAVKATQPDRILQEREFSRPEFTKQLPQSQPLITQRLIYQQIEIVKPCRVDSFRQKQIRVDQKYFLKPKTGEPKLQPFRLPSVQQEIVIQLLSTSLATAAKPRQPESLLCFQPENKQKARKCLNQKRDVLDLNIPDQSSLLSGLNFMRSKGSSRVVYGAKL